MKKYIKKFIAVIVSMAITLSMVSIDSFKAEEITMNNEELIMNNESVNQDTNATENIIETTSENVANDEIITGKKDEEVTSEEPTSDNGNGEESTSGESETVIYNENQNRVVNQIKTIPEKTQEDYMDKVKLLYIDYMTLTEDEVNGLSENDKAEYESILKTAGDINHTDAITGVSVSAEDLPWYVKVVAEKTDEIAFQETYEAYWDSLYEQWEDSNEELDEDDEYDEEYEEEYEEDWEDSNEELIMNNEEYDEWEDEESQNYDEYDDSEDYEDDVDYEGYFATLPRTTLGYTIDENRFYDMASSYKVSLYNILEEKEYILPEGTKVKISLPYLKEYMGYGLEIVQIKDDSSYDVLKTQLFNKSLGQILTYELYTELYGDSIYNEELTMNNEESEDEDNYEDENYEEYEEDWDDEDEELDEDDGWDEEAYRKWAEEENGKINIDDYVVEFETGSFSEFAVRLVDDYGWISKDMATGAIAIDENKESVISPKTGNNLGKPIAMIIGSGLLIGISLFFYRKREEDIV